MKQKSQEALTWVQINNIFPIITSVVLVALSWAAINTRLSILETKMDNMIILLKDQQNQQARLITDLNQVHDGLSRLQAIHSNN